MKQAMKRMLALTMALLLALPTFTLAEESPLPEEPAELEEFLLGEDADRADEPSGSIDPDQGQPLPLDTEVPQGLTLVRAAVTPADAAVTLFAAIGEGADREWEIIEPQAGADWLLAPGMYAYSAWAEGYVAAERVAFEVPEAEEAFELVIALEKAEEENVEEVAETVEEDNIEEAVEPVDVVEEDENVIDEAAETVAEDEEDGAEETSSDSADALPPSGSRLSPPELIGKSPEATGNPEDSRLPEGKAFGEPTEENIEENNAEETAEPVDEGEAEDENIIEENAEPVDEGEAEENYTEKTAEPVDEGETEDDYTEETVEPVDENTEEAAEPVDEGEAEENDIEEDAVVAEPAEDAAEEIGVGALTLGSGVEVLTDEAAYGAEEDEEPVNVYFNFEPADAELLVFPAPTEDDPEPFDIFPEEDGSYLLVPGSYTYSAEAEGYKPIQNHPFEVMASDESMTISFAMEEITDDETPEPGDAFSSWLDLQEAIDAAEDGAVLALDTDLCAEAEGGAALLIPAGKSITLDLGGCSLSRELSAPEADGCVIIVEGDLILVDKNGGGVITGGRNTGNGGAIRVAAGGRLTLDGAVIEGNTAQGMGGGVYADGAFVMKQGSIDGNVSDVKGGGVYFTGSFEMKGGVLADNEPQDLCLDKPMTVSGSVEVSDALIANPDADYSILVTDSLGNASIRLSVAAAVIEGGAARVTSGLNARGELKNFKMAKNGDFDVALDDDGELMIARFATVTFLAGEDSTATEKVSVRYDTDYELPGNPFDEPAGRPFQAWLVEWPDESTELKQPGEFIHVTEELSITAQWTITWSGLQSMIDNAGWGDTLRLPSGLTRTTASDRLTIPYGKKITLNLAGYTLDGANIGDAAVIYVEGSLTLTDTVGGRITGGTAGGVVVDGSGSFTLEAGEISGNVSPTMGGGVLVNSGSFIMDGDGSGGLVCGNTAVDGGGVGVAGGSFELKRGRVDGNSAKNGGGVAVTGGSFVLNGGRVSDNAADGVGGGVSVQEGASFEMKGGSISGNEAKANGGGLALESGAAVELTGGTIDKNTTAGQGGGIYADQADFAINGLAVTENEAPRGGGVALNGGKLTLQQGEIGNNRAASGDDTAATTQGGGLYVLNGTATLNGGSVSGNSARYGGGAFVVGGQLVMPENIIESNTAEVGGAGVAFSGVNPELPALACVRNNQVDRAEANYWLQDGAIFQVTEPLDSAYQVYVTAEMPGEGVRVIASGEKLSRDNFISADMASYVSSRNKDGDVILGAPLTVRFSAGDGSGTMADDTVARGGGYTLPTAGDFTAPTGLDLLGWVVDNDAYWDKETKAVGYNLIVEDDMLVTEDDGQGGTRGVLKLKAQWGKGTLYVDENGTNHIAALVKPLSAYQGKGQVTLGTGWYLADGATFDARVVASGDVNIIIDNVHTTTMSAGILVPSGSTLSVWGEGGWEQASGKLVATGGQTSNAGIGGAAQTRPGTFALHSGEVEAIGGYNAAGVGGGDGVFGGTVVIHGGKLTARGGESGAGIGGGMSASQGGMVSIYGGTVYAYGGENAAGIGGGKYSGTVQGDKFGGDGGQVSIIGATVYAEGGLNGAGIGGGSGGSGGSVSINLGAAVTAVAGRNPYAQGAPADQPQAIGRGFQARSGLSEGEFTLVEGSEMFAGDNAASATLCTDSVEEGRKKSYVKINPTQGLPTTFFITAQNVDAQLTDVKICKAADLTQTVGSADFGESMAVKISPKGAYNHFDGIDITYNYHGETLSLTDYSVQRDGEAVTVQFDMPMGDVIVVPKIRTDTFKVTINVLSGNGTAYASVDGVTVTEAPVGKQVLINCKPGGEAWFLVVHQENARPKSQYKPYVYYKKGTETVVLTTPMADSDTPMADSDTPMADGNRNVRTFTMPPADVTVDLTFQEGKYYYDANGVRQFREDYHTLDPNDTDLYGGGDAGSWYYVGESMTLKNRVTFHCEVNLILGPGVTLTCSKGLNVPYSKGGKLYLYEEVKNGGSVLRCDASGQEKCAGIGGDDGEQGGTVCIIGGSVVATGGHKGAGIGGGNHAGLREYIQYGGAVTAKGGKYGAGIGGGEGYDGSEEDGIKGSVRIEGGWLTATGGGYAAGIGGGQSMHQGGPVYIKGGTVYANGGKDGAGIGGGEEFDPRTTKKVGGNGGEVHIDGGQVIAKGSGDSAGIGGGQDGKGGHFYMTGGKVEAHGSNNSAGIGGANNEGGDVDISGGWVYAYGGDDGAGIGGGDDGKVGTINISGGTIYAYGGGDGAGIGTGCWGEGGTINISGGEVHADGGTDAAGIGGGDAGCVKNINITNGCVYAYGQKRSIGMGDYSGLFDGSGNTKLKISYYEVNVADSKTGSKTRVTKDALDAIKGHKYAEIIRCRHREIGRIVSVEPIDGQNHRAFGECAQCRCNVEQIMPHEYTYGIEPVSFERLNIGDALPDASKYHLYVGECICGHYYSEPREHSFTSYTCEPLEEGFFVNGYSWVSGHDYHRKISVCECGFESESVEEHNYGPDNDSQLCLLCGQSRPTCTMYLFREDDPIGAIYGLNRLPNVEFGTIFELPDCPWELPAGTDFQGWRYRNAIYQPHDTVTIQHYSNGFYAVFGHTHDGLRFEPWSYPNALPSYDDWMSSGDGTGNVRNFFLANDVVLDRPWRSPGYTTNLCLNGHTITLVGDAYIEVLGKGSQLNIYDGEEGGGRIVNETDNGECILVENNGLLQLMGGTIVHGSGNGVRVSLGTFNMVGGTVKGKNGNAIYIDGGSGIVNLSGGTVDGGTIYNTKGGFIMTGGLVTNAVVEIGGEGYLRGGRIENASGYSAVVVHNWFRMEGGEITGSKRGVYVSGAEKSDDYAKFEMMGGEIHDNDCGVWMDAQSDSFYVGFVMTGGEIHDNRGNGGVSGVRAGAYSEFELRDGRIYDNTGTVSVYNEGKLVMTGGEITGNTGTNCGGVSVDGSAASFYMKGGRIADNHSDGYGGGLIVGSAVKILSLEGGEITGNSADRCGGGVYISPGFNFRTVEQKGPDDPHTYINGEEVLEKYYFTTSITNNSAKLDGGGVYLGTGSSLTVTDQTLSGNTAGRNGGGVYAAESARLTVNGASLKGNGADLGGGIYFGGGQAVLEGTSVTGNTATGNGGGVYAASGSFTMNDGELSGNTATGNGGGMYTLMNATLGKCTITGNSAGGLGGGVYFGDGRLALGNGKVIIQDNAKDNLYLPDGKALTLESSLSKDSVIHVLPQYQPDDSPINIGTATTDYTSCFFNDGDDDEAYFDWNSAGNHLLLRKDAEVGLWSELQALINTRSWVKLEKDYIAEDYDTCLLVGKGRNIRLDLNGHRIDRNLADKEPEADGCVIKVDGGTLTVLDARFDTKPGVITGGNNRDGGGGIRLVNEGKLTLSGAIIAGNRTEKDGGGVYLSYIDTMTSGLTALSLSNKGVIRDNEAVGNGGGVYMRGLSISLDSANISGNRASNGGGLYLEDAALKAYYVTIEDNEAARCGGGVYAVGAYSNDYDKTFFYYGGTVTGNRAGTNGGGLYAANGGEVRLMYGESFDFTGNTVDDKPNNLYLDSDMKISAASEPYKTSRIGITTAVAPTATSPVVFTGKLKSSASPEAFIPDDDACEVAVNASGEAELRYIVKVTVAFDANGGSGEMASVRAKQNGEYTLPECGFTAPEGFSFMGWQVGEDAGRRQPGETITLDGDVTLKAVWAHEHDGIAFEPWTSENSLPTRAGSYFLTKDVYLKERWTVSGRENNVNLCLNGHRIQAADYHAFAGLEATYWADMTLYDDVGTGYVEDLENTDCVQVYSNSLFTLCGGGLRDGVRMTSGSRFDLKGGTVYGTSVPSGGTMNMSGGAVTRDGVTVKGTFNMTGGAITGSANGGLRIAAGATVTLAGGAITGNTRDGKPCNVYLEEGAKLTIPRGYAPDAICAGRGHEDRHQHRRRADPRGPGGHCNGNQ